MCSWPQQFHPFPDGSPLSRRSPTKYAYKIKESAYHRTESLNDLGVEALCPAKGFPRHLVDEDGLFVSSLSVKSSVQFVRFGRPGL